MQPKLACCAIAWMLVFAPMAFAEPSGTAGMPYANISASLMLDNATRSCFLDVNYSSEALSYSKHLNITGGAPASISAANYQSVALLRRSLDSGGGFFTCELFTNGTSECYGRSPSGMRIRIPPISDIVRSLGVGLIGPFLASLNDTAGFEPLCPYFAEANATNAIVASQQGTGGTAKGGGPIMQDNITGHGPTSGAVYANMSNATAVANATSNTGMTSVIAIFASAIAIVAIVALLLYAVKRGQPSSYKRK